MIFPQISRLLAILFIPTEWVGKLLYLRLARQAKVDQISVPPLADRLRPRSMDQFVGQEHLLAPGRPLASLLANETLHSMILWGPPGTGKTTFARLLARKFDFHWIALSAVLSGIKDVRLGIEDAKEKLPQRTVLFVDEVHRFNKVQQDAFLPHVESGLLTLIGATTENPSFEVNSALLSRTHVYVFEKLNKSDMQMIVQRAMDELRVCFKLSDDGLDALCDIADGDARRALNVVEASSRLDISVLDDDAVAQAAGFAFRRFDKHGDAFYDQISALHKAIRGSSPDAALYWFARMIAGGCDPLYIARRLVRIATEDIGTADPRCLNLAICARDAYRHLGTPEGELALAETVVYFATVPKSNAVDQAYTSAMEYVRSHPSYPVPNRFKNAPTQLAKDLGHGKGYRYAHDEEKAYAAGERYFPDEMDEVVFYDPSEQGVERQISARLTTLRALDEKVRRN